MKNYIEFETPQGTRTKNVIIRVTPEEKTLLVIGAKECGVSLSAFIRLLVHNWHNHVNLKKGE